ncbi:MAG: PTS IIA-like nitrogen regulatory protein PtsN [Pseudomonadota bacterium]
MELADLVRSDCTLPSVKATSKKQVLQEIAHKASEIHGLHCGTVVNGLVAREKLGSTAMGNGVAIPHARIEGLDTIIGLFARLEKPVDFEAADSQGVDLIFTLLAPEAAGANHLRALAKVSRLMRDEQFRAKLRASDNSESLHALLTENPASRAA